MNTKTLSAFDLSGRIALVTGASKGMGRSIAAILTGMGNDGTEGMRMLKRGGSLTIAQDAASCVVFGMPREAILAGVVDTVAPLGMIAGTIMRAVAEVRA